jgi:acetyl esterase/lipase
MPRQFALAAFKLQSSLRPLAKEKPVMKKSIVLAAAAVTALTLNFAAQGNLAAQGSGWPPSSDHLTLPVWPGAAPGEPANMPPEADTTTPKDHLVAGRAVIRLGNVSSPTLTLYKPAGKSTGAAVLVFPGGGYRIDSIDLEGTEVCDWLNSIGVTCVLLKYRVPDSGPYPDSPAALQDAQRAMGLVRAHAAEWGIDPNRVGVLGFSAGGHLSAAISNHYDHRLYDPIDDADKLSCRPDFSVVIYPGYLALADKNYAPNPDIQPTAGTPPTFIAQAEDDPVHVENSVVYFMQLKNAKVPAELHIYSEGGHGYGLRPRDLPIMGWPKLVDTWLHTIKVLPAE